MLILTRRPGESCRIGDDIEVVVLAKQGNQVRLAIKAPPDVKVLRNELLEKAGPSARPAPRRRPDSLRR